MRLYPALSLTFSGPATQDRVDQVLALLDDFRPTAIEDIDDGLRAFFATVEGRDAAFARLQTEPDLDGAATDVSDEDWATRSQSALTPVIVDTLIIAPPWTVTPELRASAPGPIIVIQPSMGFGTGHHATTRLCLRWLQKLPLEGLSVLDVGTGSGVLAIAASVLGASRVVGIDIDPDALANARENIDLNHVGNRVELRECDLSATVVLGSTFDVITANLTGSLLCRDASVLAALSRPGGRLVASGFQTHEADQVVSAFTAAGWTFRESVSEQDWVAVLARGPVQG